MRAGRFRDVASFVVLLVFASMLMGTKKPGRTTDPSPTPGTAPLDVDINRLILLGRCATTLPHPACRLLRDFEQGDSWSELAPKTLYFGESFGIGGSGDSSREFFFVTAERGPVGLTGAARTLIVDNATERKDATDLLNAVRFGRTIPTSKAAAFMRTAPPPKGSQPVIRTTGKSVAFSEVPPKAFVRKRFDRLIVVEFSDGSPLGHDRGGVANAWVAELFLVR